MKKKIIGLVVSGLMVSALLLASCAGEVTKKTEVTPSTKEVTPATKEVVPAEKAGMVKLSLKKLDGTPVEKWVEAPRYGGTVILSQNKPDTAWDDFSAGHDAVARLELTVNSLLQGDWTRGSAGTEETTWWASDWYPQFETGDVAASWEIPDAETIIYHIRKGVHWQNKPPVNGREFTAEDAAFAIGRIFGTTKSNRGKRAGPGMWFISATAVDKYTVVLKGKEQAVGMSVAFSEISEKFYLLPPEVIQKYGDMSDWRNVVGSGPFIVVDNIEDSAATFQRNPNYWKKDLLFPENQLPYVDRVKVLIIPDESTRFAGLRTGRLDYVRAISWEDAEQLLKTNPMLGFSKQVADKSEGILSGRVDTKPFDDIRVRRALAMAIDRPAILRDYYRGNAQLISFPLIDIPEFVMVYTPLEELPESTRELYEYHPDKAKQLLAEAGYPQGFKFTAVLQNSDIDMAEIYKADLAKVGVNMELNVKEYGVFRAMVRTWPPKHKEAALSDTSIGRIYLGTNLYPGAGGNVAYVNDPVINKYKARLTSFELMQNQPELDRLAKELTLYVMSQSYMIAPPVPFIYEMWSPWVKNFYGMNMGTSNTVGAVPYLWIDQGLKAQMGR